MIHQMSQLVDVRTVADSPLTSARTWPTAPLPRRGTDAGRLQHKSAVSRQAANTSAQAAHNDYQDLQINGVRVETYGKPSAAPPLLFVHGGCQGRRGCDVGLIVERGPAPAR